MGFQLVPKLMTSNNLELCNGRVACIISLNSLTFWTYYVKVVEDTLIHSVNESPKNLVFNNISLWRYLQGITPSEGVKVKRPPIAS